MKLVDTLIMQEWNLRWTTDTQYVHTKIFYPEVDISKTKHILRHSRSYVQTLVRAITGHNFLAKHQNRIGNPVAPECRLCEENFETFIHLITEYPRLKQAREDIFLDTPPDDKGQWKMGLIFKFIYSTVVNELLLEKDNYNELPIIHFSHNLSLIHI